MNSKSEAPMDPTVEFAAAIEIVKQHRYFITNDGVIRFGLLDTSGTIHYFKLDKNAASAIGFELFALCQASSSAEKGEYSLLPSIPQFLGFETAALLTQIAANAGHAVGVNFSFVTPNGLTLQTLIGPRLAAETAEHIARVLHAISGIPADTPPASLGSSLQESLADGTFPADNGYRYGAAVQFSKDFRLLLTDTKSHALSHIAKSFARNIERVVSMCAFPIELIDATRKSTLSAVRARLILGLDATDQSKDDSPAFRDARLALLNEEPNNTVAANDSWARGNRLINDLVELLRNRTHPEDTPDEAKEYFFGGADALLGSMITLAYGALEALASDLWIQSMNSCDSVALDWIKKSENRGKFSEVFGDGLDLRGKIGTRLSDMGAVQFTSLKSIRSIYLETFGVDASKHLTSTDLVATEKMRHLLAHRSGVIDRKFKSDVKDFPQFRDLPIGSDLPISGPLVRDAVNSCVLAGVGLFKEIDLIVSRHES